MSSIHSCCDSITGAKSKFKSEYRFQANRVRIVISVHWTFNYYFSILNNQSSFLSLQTGESGVPIIKVIFHRISILWVVKTFTPMNDILDYESSEFGAFLFPRQHKIPRWNSWGHTRLSTSWRINRMCHWKRWFQDQFNSQSKSLILFLFMGTRPFWNWPKVWILTVTNNGKWNIQIES